MSIDLLSGELGIRSPRLAPDADALLVAAAKEGDRSAFDQLVDRHRQKIFILAKRITRNPEDAEEVVQESFVQAFVHLEKFNGDSRFSTWLTRIAVNEALMMLRKRRRSLEVSWDQSTGRDDEFSIPAEIADRRETPEESLSQQELRDELRNAVTRLPAKLRIAVQLREFEELTTEQTTEALGLTVAALKSRLYHARNRLRQTLSCHFQAKGSRAVGPGWKVVPVQSGALCGD
jgi:RNA polymerase sigma-70 factor (ECF subfamily)